MCRRAAADVFALICAVLLLWPALCAAQEAKDRPAPAQAPNVVMPDAEKIVLLIRTTLLTLNDAVQTGNFTVLRDRAAPSDQAANTAARLATIFASLTAQNIDLSAVAIIAPKLAETPKIVANNRLHLKGVFPGHPVQINFELLFEPVGGQWRLFGLSVNPTATLQTDAPAPDSLAGKSPPAPSKPAPLKT